MQNLVFDEGYKEFTINGDESRIIKFNPCDVAILTRIDEAKVKILEAINLSEDVELNSEGKPVDNFENATKIVKHIDDTIKEQINYIFNYEVSEVVFGKQSPMANVKGMPLYARFMESIKPVIETAMKEENEKSRKRVAKYTKGIK